MRKGLESTVTTMNSSQSGSAATTTSSVLQASKNYLATFSVALACANTTPTVVIQYSLDNSIWNTFSTHTLGNTSGTGTDSMTFAVTVPLINGIYYRTQSTTNSATNCSASITMTHLVQNG